MAPVPWNNLRKALSGLDEFSLVVESPALHAFFLKSKALRGFLPRATRPGPRSPKSRISLPTYPRPLRDRRGRRDTGCALRREAPPVRTDRCGEPDKPAGARRG